MSVNISKAEQYIMNILPQVTKLQGEINTLGTYLLFDSITINNAIIDDIDYIFNLYISVSSKAKNTRLAYDPVSAALQALINDYVTKQKIEIGKIKPYAVKHLIVYQIPLTLKGYEHVDCT